MRTVSARRLSRRVVHGLTSPTLSYSAYQASLADRVMLGSIAPAEPWTNKNKKEPRKAK
jgi:hypothetical protein